MSRPSAYVLEIFSSIQGEGLYVGARHIFVRFAGCNLSCAYCDTPAGRSTTHKLCAIQDRVGDDQFRKVRNPLDVDALFATVDRLEREAPGHHSVSLTGGEPLIQTTFLLELCPDLRDTGRRLYLETNGTLVGAMEDLIPSIDIVAMDFKLESATGVPAETELHREFLTVAAAKKVFVKAVVDASTPEEEIQECAAVIALVNRRIPLVIQPATQIPGSRIGITDGRHLAELQRAASRLLEDVRVIPQCHKILGIP